MSVETSLGEQLSSRTSGNLQQSSLVFREAKGPDNQPIEGIKTAVGDSHANDIQEQQPGTEVTDTLAKLVPLPDLVLNTRLVLADAADDHGLLALRQPAGVARVIGQIEEGKDAPDDGNATQDNKEPPPAGDGSGANGDEADSVADEAVDDGGVGTKGDGVADRLFGLLVEHGVAGAAD